MAKSIAYKEGWNIAMFSIASLKHSLHQQMYNEKAHWNAERHLMETVLPHEIDYWTGVIDAIKIFEKNGYTDKDT